MICKRCQRSLRGTEGLKCGICESCFHMRCVSSTGKDQSGSGDKGYQWKCSLCQNYVSNLHSSASDTCRDKEDKHTCLWQAINGISEKFELVNKIQLPKLNSDLLQIKTVADLIVQQNEDILRKIKEAEEKRKEQSIILMTSGYRKRKISLTPKLESVLDNNTELTVPVIEKAVRYRTHRRSYLLNRIFKLLNRKMKKVQTPTK